MEAGTPRAPEREGGCSARWSGREKPQGRQAWKRLRKGRRKKRKKKIRGQQRGRRDDSKSRGRENWSGKGGSRGEGRRGRRDSLKVKARPGQDRREIRGLPLWRSYLVSGHGSARALHLPPVPPPWRAPRLAAGVWPGSSRAEARRGPSWQPPGPHPSLPPTLQARSSSFA